ncbi:alpha-amylase family glycosyl hydrolase [Enterococcus olivae]
MKKCLYSFLVLSLWTLTGCQLNTKDTSSANSETSQVDTDLYRNFYQIFVGSFYDSDGDGSGDLAGITEKLDYLNTGKADSTDDLKVNGIWLTPVMPSPSYHKYDVVDYYDIDPVFGTMSDFEQLIEEADQRGIGVIIDLVINHTSSEHPWFQAALASFGEDATEEQQNYREYYHFSEVSQAGYTKLGNGWYYESQFWSGMPDLNLDNPDVRNEIEKMSHFWLDKGIAGFRLDATSHFFENDVQKNVEFLHWFTNMVKEYKEDAYLVGEAWEDGTIIEEFYGSGLDSFFDFPFSQGSGTGVITEAVKGQNGKLLGVRATMWDEKIKVKNAEAIDAVFLSNHDNNRSAEMFDTLEQKKMAANAYLLLPGNPFIYYGEEIGMTGSGIDENKRLPMMFTISEEGQPDPPENATVMSETDGGTVEEQLQDEQSLLRWYQQILRVKNNYPVIGRGEVTLLPSAERSIALFSYKDDDQEVLVLHNLAEEEIKLELPDEYKQFTIVEQLSVLGEKGKLKKQSVKIPGMTTLIISE